MARMYGIIRSNDTVKMIREAKQLLDSGKSVKEVSSLLGMHEVIVRSIKDHNIK